MSNATAQQRFNTIIAVMIAVVTAFAAIIAYLQNEAAQHDDRAGRDARRYATEAFGRNVSGAARVSYDDNAAYQSWYELGLLADAAEMRGEDDAAARFRAARDQIAPLSPLLQPPYFDAAAAAADVSRYEAETYLVETTALAERFAAASTVKDAWDTRANTYVLHLTLLAVALFLLGLSMTIAVPLTRTLFAGFGVSVVLITIGWAGVMTAQPVPDLRARAGAIEAYAQGVGLAHQERHEEALAAFDRALAAAPDYVNALAARADQRLMLEDPAGAIVDYEAAMAAGDERGVTAGSLAWAYYLAGRHEEAVTMNQAALVLAPDELWITFDLGAADLAAGRIEAARATYAAGMESATRQVAEARAAGAVPSSDLWWSLEDAAYTVERLLVAADGERDPYAPPPSSIADPAALREPAQEIIARLKSLSVALEYTGLPPQGALEAQIGPLTFGVPDEDGGIVAARDTFPAETPQVAMVFDYAGMRDGADLVVKVYIDGEEDPSWRLIVPWELGAEGTGVYLLSPGYTDTFVMPSGAYNVELYVDGHLAQRGAFVVEE